MVLRSQGQRAGDRRQPPPTRQHGVETLEGRTLLSAVPVPATDVTVITAADPSDPGLTALVVTGTAGNDRISLAQNGADFVVAAGGGMVVGTVPRAAVTGRVYVFALDGDD